MKNLNALLVDSWYDSLLRSRYFSKSNKWKIKKNMKIKLCLIIKNMY